MKHFSACFKNRPVRGPGLQGFRLLAISGTPRALTRRPPTILKHALRIQRVLLALAFLGSLAGQLVNAATLGVRIGDYFFTPTNLVINAGDQVSWTNKVLFLHD